MVTRNPGPTTKADCLNNIIEFISTFEKEEEIHFAIIGYHDAEDVIHPLELKIFNYFIPKYDLIQLPVFPPAESALRLTGLTPVQRSQLVQLLVDNLIKTGNIDQAGRELLKLKQSNTDPDHLKAAYDRLIDFCFVENDIPKGLKWYREYMQQFGPASERTLIYWSNLLV